MGRRGLTTNSIISWLNLDEDSLEFFNAMCLEIVKLIAVTKKIQSDNPSISSSCLRTTGALINVLGPKALFELPSIMENLLKISSSIGTKTKYNDGNTSKESLLMSILITIEAVFDKLVKVDVVTKLFTEKIPLPPLISIYSEATKFGDLSLSIVFGMLGNLGGTMDRSSVRAYHANIFDLCLQALDVRRQHFVTSKNIDVVKKNIINAVIFLTMKLTDVFSS
ncbi:hypothetical protein LguiB_006580 [Lonicera macranthoides]